jgi:FMN-dependent NADH-azoreductase
LRDELNAHHQLTFLHKAIASTVLFLTALRIVWRITHPTPPLPATMSPAMQKAAHLGHYALYAIALIALPLSGWMWSSVADKPVMMLGFIHLPMLVAPAPEYYDTAKLIHRSIAWSFGLVVLGHIAAALKHHFVDKDDVLQSMLPAWLARKSNRISTLSLTQPPKDKMKILQINTSARSVGSESTRLADLIVKGITAKNAGALLTRHDLASNPLLQIDEPTLNALFTPAEQRTAQQTARVAVDDALIAEVQAADVVVIGAPMYNFGVTIQLKSWFDAIARAQVTFRYTDTGPEGLLTGKKVYVTLARGGLHQDGPTDTQVPYLKTMLGFLGMTDVQFIYAEGMGYGPEAVLKAQASAEAQIDAILA